MQSRPRIVPPHVYLEVVVPLSLRLQVTRSLVRVLLASVSAIAVIGAYLAFGPNMWANPSDSPDRDTFPRSPRMVEVERLIEKHECWADDDKPSDVIPGHAVVTRDGDTRLVDAELGFSIWLDGAPGRLHAFCP